MSFILIYLTCSDADTLTLIPVFAFSQAKVKYFSALNVHMLLKGPSTALKRDPRLITIRLFTTKELLQTQK